MTTQDQGLSLADIAPAHEDVDIGGPNPLRVYGISARGLFGIFQTFPEVAQWFKGGRVDVKSLAAQVPHCLAAIIAAGCGFAGDPKMEQKAENLAAESQLDVLEAIARLTFRSGFGPFVQRMVLLLGKAESQNYGRGLGTTSPPASPTALPPDMTAPQFGT